MHRVSAVCAPDCCLRALFSNCMDPMLPDYALLIECMQAERLVQQNTEPHLQHLLRSGS